MQEVFENELPSQWKLVTCLNESVIAELSRENNPKGRFFLFSVETPLAYNLK